MKRKKKNSLFRHFIAVAFMLGVMVGIIVSIIVIMNETAIQQVLFKDNIKTECMPVIKVYKNHQHKKVKLCRDDIIINMNDFHPVEVENHMTNDALGSLIELHTEND